MIMSDVQLSWSNGKTAAGEAGKRRRDSGLSPELSETPIFYSCVNKYGFFSFFHIWWLC